MALRSLALLFPCCAAAPTAAPLLFQFSPRMDDQRRQHVRPMGISSSVKMRSDFDSTRDRDPSAPPQSWQEGGRGEQASMLGGKGGRGGVHGFGDGRLRLGISPSATAAGLFAKRQSSRPGARGAVHDAGVRGRGSTHGHFRRIFAHQQDWRGCSKVGLKVETSGGRGEGNRRSAAVFRTTCGNPEATATGGLGGSRRRQPWLCSRTHQQQPLHLQRSANVLGYFVSGGGRRCTAVFMTASKGDGGGVDWSGPTTGPNRGAEGGGRPQEDKGPNGETELDRTSFVMRAEEQALPPPARTAPSATEQRTKKTAGERARLQAGIAATTVQRQRVAGAHTATASVPPQEDDASSGINGFELEAAAGGGEFAEAEAMGPVSESYERGRWLLGLLALQSTSSFVLDKYQDLLRQHVVVTLFLTMLVGAGGNAGNQSAIKVIRGLATGSFTADAPCALRVVGEEAVVGLLLGTALAAGGFVRVWVTEGTTLRDASAISMSLFLIVMVSVLLGSGLPFGFARAGVDPAHAGTTIQVAMDIVGVAVTCVTCSFVLTQLEQSLPLPL